MVEPVVRFSDPVPSPNGWHKRILATREVTSPGATVTSVSDSYEVASTPPGESKEARKARLALGRQNKRRCVKGLEAKLPVVAAEPKLPVRHHRKPPAFPYITHVRCSCLRSSLCGRGSATPSPSSATCSRPSRPAWGPRSFGARRLRATCCGGGAGW